jgi:hypothetical protein
LHDLCFFKIAFEILICFSFCPLRARIETMSSISESLQCRQRINENETTVVPNPYCFDDYMRAMSGEHRGIKEGCGSSRWQTQPQSPPFFLPQDLYNLNSFKYAVHEESHCLKVHYIHPHQKEYFSLCHLLLPAFFNGLSVMLVLD